MRCARSGRLARRHYLRSGRQLAETISSQTRAIDGKFSSLSLNLLASEHLNGLSAARPDRLTLRRHSLFFKVAPNSLGGPFVLAGGPLRRPSRTYGRRPGPSGRRRSPPDGRLQMSPKGSDICSFLPPAARRHCISAKSANAQSQLAGPPAGPPASERAASWLTVELGLVSLRHWAREARRLARRVVRVAAARSPGDRRRRASAIAMATS